MSRIIAFHGGQGSGKSTLSGLVTKAMASRGDAPMSINIKDTFSRYAEQIAKDLGMDRTGKDLLAFKELQKAISCSVEQHYNPTAWSDAYVKMVRRYPSFTILTDDIRTPMNLEALCKLAEDRDVILFKLNASETVRRARCSAWRENAGYTERELVRPDHLPDRFRWVNVSTMGPKEQTETLILEVLGIK